MREEQDLDGDGQTRVQSNDNDEQDARRLGVDGGDDWVAACVLVTVMSNERMGG